MPIRFRCTNCDQLMGIARRKAGSLVRCPACRSEIAVPADADDDSPAIPAPVPVPAARPDLFDRDDFDALLAGGASLAGARPAPPPVPAPRPLAGPVEAKAKSAGPEPVAVSLVPVQGGLVLSPGWVTTLTVVFLLLLAMAFALGLLVGRHALAP